MLPTAFADFSSAGSWVAGGFLAGLLVYAIIRALLGIDRRRIADLQTAQAELGSSRRVVDALSKDAAELDAASTQIANLREQSEAQTSTAKYYEGQYGVLFAEHDALAKKEKATAFEIVQLKAELARVSSSAADLAKVRGELAAAVRRHEAEIAQLQAQPVSPTSAALQDGIDPEMYESDVAALRGTVDELRAAVAASEEALTQSRMDIEQLQAQLVSPTQAALQDGIDPEMYESDVAALRGTVDELRTAMAASEEALTQSRTDIAQLNAKLAASPADLGQYQRLREAVEAANRIASGWPEKAGA